jgi:mannosyltransferase OCH1-like enzyme
MSIPKILHYCWFGNGAFPKREEKCYKSWEKHLSDFEFRRWDESNFDIHCNKYVEQAYEARKFMYVSDYARLLALYKEGGLYLDTDCLVKKNFSTLMGEKAFTGYGGDNREIAAHTLAFPPNHPFVKECLDSYENQAFVNEDGTYNLYTINMRMTDLLIQHGFVPNGTQQEICGITIYPMTYFCPISMLPDTVKDCKSKNTYCIHVWSSKELKRERSLIVRLAHKTGLNKVKRKLMRE